MSVCRVCMQGGHYTKYSSTVTHGLPGVLSITLDLYAPVGAKAVA